MIIRSQLDQVARQMGLMPQELYRALRRPLWMSRIPSMGKITKLDAKSLASEDQDDPVRGWKVSRLRIGYAPKRGGVLMAAFAPSGHIHSFQSAAFDYPNRALMRCPSGHEVPTDHPSYHGCGFYAYKDRAVTERKQLNPPRPECLLLEADLYGTVIEASWGYRASGQLTLSASVPQSLCPCGNLGTVLDLTQALKHLIEMGSPEGMLIWSGDLICADCIPAYPNTHLTLERLAELLGTEVSSHQRGGN